MNKSENIGNLAKALSQVLGEIQDPIKNKAGHNSSYADLPQVLSIIRPLMTKYNLSVIQLPCEASDGKVAIETMIMHESGEWISKRYEMDKITTEERLKLKSLSDAQATGIIITYARRYALTALFSICAQEDTDGNIANSNRKLTGKELENLLKSCNNNKERIEGIMKWANITNINDITFDKYTEALEIIKKQEGK